MDFELACKILGIFSDSSSDVMWRTDGVYSPVTFFVICSDVFAWGCADCEEVNAGNISVLEQAYKDCKDLDCSEWTGIVFLL